MIKIIFINKSNSYFWFKFTYIMKIILPLVSWGNGAFMIAVFAVVCVVLIGVVLSFVMGGKKSKKTN